LSGQRPTAALDAPRDRPRVRAWLAEVDVPMLGAIACSALLALVWLVAFRVDAGRRGDQSLLRHVEELDRGRLHDVLSTFAHLGDPLPLVAAAAAIALGALVLRSPRVATACVLAVLGANMTTQALKPALASARPTTAPIGVEAWPSGHTTAVASLAVAAAIAVPAAWRLGVAAASGLAALATGISLIALGWHFPSDVAGGLLIATAWGCALASLLGRPSTHGPAG
jgi:membrane-associated phospholipid phosphatase